MGSTAPARAVDAVGCRQHMSSSSTTRRSCVVSRGRLSGLRWPRWPRAQPPLASRRTRAQPQPSAALASQPCCVAGSPAASQVQIDEA
eukprot:2225579-Pleurochrysis_carterae.AAC.5